MGAAELDAHDAAVVEEYKHLPRATFRAGRRAFLEKLLARPRLFSTALFRSRLEQAARGNLSRVVARYPR